ncbi:MAG: hypothetical protein P4K94_05610 [Terracidiphilus sp.]|nr:hypothetical protein [Terracidiphilus sp.]
MRAGLILAAAALLLCASRAVQAQSQAQRLPDKPSLPPAASIPVEQLGFSAPGSLYLGQRLSMVSLDFLDENRVLFTFRVPGLMRREAEDSDQRQIRALVLAVPSGAVLAEAVWTLHDRARYLWMLKDGHFLLRDRDTVVEGGGDLQTKPLLQFPGALLWMEMDPTGRYMVTSSREPAPAVPQSSVDSQPAAHSDPLQAPATASANLDTEEQKPAGQPDLVVRILRRDTGKVILVSRARTTVHLPVNADGYLEALRGRGLEWLLNMNYFVGGSEILGHIDSTCTPIFDFISQQEVLVTACDKTGARTLIAISTRGKRLWQDTSPVQAIWPLLAMGPDGSRLAQETLAVTHTVNAYEPLGREDVKGQLVRIFDAATGKVALEAPASPALDAGGNVAISPSGRRVAVLNAGAIRIFDLPPPPPLTF